MDREEPFLKSLYAGTEERLYLAVPRERVWLPFSIPQDPTRVDAIEEDFPALPAEDTEDEAIALVVDGTPRRTRTYNQLIKSQLLYH